MSGTHRWFGVVMGVTLGTVASASAVAADTAARTNEPPHIQAMRQRIEKALDGWCRWLSSYLYQVPDTDLYTMNPTLGTGANPYRDVAGNAFAAAVAGQWLGRTQPDEAVARPLEGLVKLSLGTHIAARTIDRPDIQIWGAGLWPGDSWHADLFVVAQAMLALDVLPSDQRQQLLAMLRFEADKQIQFMAEGLRVKPGLWPEHSCGESNAWSAALLQMARLAIPEPQRQDAWRTSAIEYSFNAICTPADMQSEQIIAGQPLKQWVKGANFEPGGIQEHHGFYHPGYMGWSLAYQAYAYVLDQLLPEPQRNPDVYLHNWKLAFDRLKQSTLSNGRFIYPAGDDWITYGYGNTEILPAALFAAVHYGDPDAMRLADQWLARIEFEQSLGGGSILGKRLATMRRQRINDFSWYESQEACCLAQALWVLDHMDTTNAPPPASEEAYNARNVGTYHEPNARLAWYRDAKTWASFSWRSAFGQWQSLVQPVQLPHLLKFNHNGLGIVEMSGVERELKLGAFAIETLPDGGFWAIGEAARDAKKVIHGRPNNRVAPLVRQYQALVVLPEGPTVFIDYGQAQDQLWLLRTGGLGLRLAADVFTRHQVTLTVDGQEKTFGQSECRDTWHDLGTRSVIIEKRLTIHALRGEGTFQLMQKRQRPIDGSETIYPNDAFGADESLLTHELYFGPPGYDRPRLTSPQEWFRKLVLILYCDPEKTPVRPAGQVLGEFPCVAIQLPDANTTVIINFAQDEQRIVLPAGEARMSSQSVKVVR